MKRILFSLMAVLAVTACGGRQKKAAQEAAAPEAAIYDISITKADESLTTMADYKGKVLLVVNTATRCGFTPQYEELEAMYEKYRDQGLEILDFPCNQFGGQAPGTAEEIKEFCTGTYNTQFPQFAKIDVNGDNAAPLFVYLKEQKGFEGFGESESGKRMAGMMERMDPDFASKPDIKWNFTKFLIDREGNVIARYEPMAPMFQVEDKIKELL